MRPVTPARRSRPPASQSGSLRLVALCLVLIGLVVIFNLYRQAAGRTGAAVPEIRSGFSGLCLDDHHNGAAPNAAVDIWSCNGRASQAWTVGSTTIQHAGRCLEAAGTHIVLNNCNGRASQQWAVDQGGFENPSSGLCLAAPSAKAGRQAALANCSRLSNLNESWSVDTWSATNISELNCNTGNRGQRVTCYAEKQWAAWQAGSPSHATLLADYTDGNGYEQWCADFVSYVYKEAGYPFDAGERGTGGWDEYDANNIQNMGFTLHPAGSYSPQPGDVAFFNYSGGHVEIVVKGGSQPTFIYGDSGTTDPATGNGEMNEDMLTSDGSAGQVVYYLSPD